ncbi:MULTISPECIES: LacI family DNA-binding transcriptional regulator [unclassified Methylobacterium]|jgi:LacI family transcriptional regulator|uniref:LacI family DNA-binding transcriptional regulator n=1 Tax=unclassified Methylobacterium TaxID=2615210 RepID=UPI0013553A59|nr:LacI family DNA-binding transcriptional regulator [Methylobacterium sp. 2A]MWV24618.1 LacI family transcriptional regulator [Methylobacterium sp. 2A]
MGQTTIKDVARRAGFSFQTVSLVLNHPEKVARTTRATIEAAMRDLDFVPSLAARALRKKPSRSIACVSCLGAETVDDGPDPAPEEDQGLVLQAFAQVTDQHGYTLIHRRCRSGDPDSLARIASLVSEARADGLVIFAERRDDPLIALLRAKRVPFVVFGLDVPGAHCAARAERDAVHEAVAYLARTGSRAIGFLGGARAAERFRGYRDALAEAGLPVSADLVAPCDWTSADGYRATCALLDRPSRPDAIVAANDRVAFGVLKALHDRGVRVPGDVRVVGFDNLAQGAYTIPSLTSIAVPTLDMVRFAFATLVAVIEGARAPDDLARKLFATRLVLRESTAARTQP